MVNKKFLATLVLLYTLTACVNRPKDVEYVYVNKPATPPQGAQQMCWLEPKVKYEEQRAGLNPERTFYVAHHVAVKEVKQGRWVRCDSEEYNR